MKFLLPIIVTHLQLAFALPTEVESRQVYDPCPYPLFDSAYCCTQGTLGQYENCTSPVLLISDDTFKLSCTLFSKIPACCIPPLIGALFLCASPPLNATLAEK
ncbi:hypothetical protein GGR51DRAFT_524892 [Nemania sp. FL0031]|nr:hypothetical protein GGR51DRAFT_524892 [Nemania sp. FL0031]